MVNPAPILCCLWFRLDVNLKVKTLKVEKKWNKNYFKGLILTLICVFCDWSLAGLAKPHGCFSCGFFLLCSTQHRTALPLRLTHSLVNNWPQTTHTYTQTASRARLRFADLNRSRLPLNCPPRHNHTSLDPYTRPQRVKDLGKTLKALKCWHAHINTQTHTHTGSTTTAYVPCLSSLLFRRLQADGQLVQARRRVGDVPLPLTLWWLRV